MGGTGAQNKDGRENSSGRSLGGDQEGELHQVDTELNSDPGAAEMESQFNGNDQQLLSEVSCSFTGGGRLLVAGQNFLGISPSTGNYINIVVTPGPFP